MDRIKIQLQGRDFGRDLFLFYFQNFLFSFNPRIFMGFKCSSDRLVDTDIRKNISMLSR